MNNKLKCEGTQACLMTNALIKSLVAGLRVTQHIKVQKQKIIDWHPGAFFFLSQNYCNVKLHRTVLKLH